jgi:hypothetical protein
MWWRGIFIVMFLSRSRPIGRLGVLSKSRPIGRLGVIIIGLLNLNRDPMVNIIKIMLLNGRQILCSFIING